MNIVEIEETRRQVTSLPWYHTIDLGHGIVTPGDYDHRPYLEHYGFPNDLSGKTALDIGAASGFFAFEMEKRGARVTATDLPEWMAHDFGPAFRPDQTPENGRSYLADPFALAKRLLGSHVEKREINIYDISPLTMGVFDLVFCGSVLCHLTDPIKALWRIQSVTKEFALIATPIHPRASHEPLALFIGHERGDGWWIPNRTGFELMIQSAGFKRWEWVSEFWLDYRDGRPGPYHGVIRAWNTLETPGGPEQALVRPKAMPELVSQREPEQGEEIVRLRELVAGYERGRFIRFTKWLRNLHWPGAGA